MSPAVSNTDKKLYRKSPRGQGGAVALDAETARVFAVLDGNLQLSKVAELAGVGTAALWIAIAKLTRLGLIEVADSTGGFMGQQFVDAVQNEFAKAVGPISNILFQKTVGQMDIALPNIPVDRARELVNRLVGHIPDEKDRAAFQQNLLKDI